MSERISPGWTLKVCSNYQRPGFKTHFPFALLPLSSLLGMEGSLVIWAHLCHLILHQESLGFTQSIAHLHH